MIKVNPEIDLGPTGQLSVAARWPNSLRFQIEFSNGWFDSRPDVNGTVRSSYAELPPELQPYQRPEPSMPAPPTRGTWRAGQRVWATAAALRNRSGWEGGLPSQVAGWVCVESGTPGHWRGIAVKEYD